jgi:hypothetical protein
MVGKKSFVDLFFFTILVMKTYLYHTESIWVEIHKNSRGKFLVFSKILDTFENQLHFENRYFIIFNVDNIN